MMGDRRAWLQGGESAAMKVMKAIAHRLLATAELVGNLTRRLAALAG
jgi:hypothetical protein